MTSPPESTPTGTRTAGSVTGPMRELIGLALIGANALLLLAAVINFFIRLTEDGFAIWAGGAFFEYVGLLQIALPVLAVLVATHVTPPVGKAKMISQVALVEYAVSALFAVITFFSWLIGGAQYDGFGRSVTSGLLTRLAHLLLFAVAALVVFKIWQALFHVPKPKAQPGVYGQPYGQPGYPPAGYPQQGGYPGQPGQQQPGYPQQGGYPGQPGQQPGYPQGYGQPTAQAYGYGQPTGGQPGYPPSPYGQPQPGAPGGQYGYPVTGTGEAPGVAQSSAPPAAPVSGTPASTPPSAPISAPSAPTSAPPGAPAPGTVPPAQGDPGQQQGAEPTQVIRTAGDPDAGERTQMINPNEPRDPYQR